MKINRSLTTCNLPLATCHFKSIFNDVIGPVMVGPSSSHTAASVRIGYLVRCLCDHQPEQVTCEFSSSGSLAFCHEGQGTDMGLAGGLLGLAPEDERMASAVDLARQTGLELEFVITDAIFAHPNTYQLHVKGGGRQFSAVFVSSGGGMIELQSLNGIPLSIDGGYHETLFLLEDCTEETAQQALQSLSTSLAEYEDICLTGNGAGSFIIDVKSAKPMVEQKPENRRQKAGVAELNPIDCIITPKNYGRLQAAPTRRPTSTERPDNVGAACSRPQIEQPFSISSSISPQLFHLPPVLPIQSHKQYHGLFNTAAEIEALAQEQSLNLAELAILYESRRGHITEEEVFIRMWELLSVMQKAIKRAEGRPEYADRILPPQAHLLKKLKKSTLLPNPALNTAIHRITLLMEAKSAMLPIVAAPTAGSCAALPGTIIGAAESLDKREDEMVEALLAAAMVGVLIAQHATFAAEVGGCQAECGAASGMAAAGLVQLMGGSAKEALNAANLALQNVFGLVCDPIAARVEAPCLGRNIMAGANALAMAQAALAGFDPLIPLDETIAAMHEVGQKIDASLRCTCQGGLSNTPAARAIEARS